ncbi:MULTISPECIES: heavy metal translocating P-type ATPase [Cupriavidus]|uniref:P-type Zn(2+) transporter n=1 Tax=Cupriavidus campinensis TaxID=151783 RepID=A0AAE9I560_9BURK|nr:MULTISPECIES: heavy metal translocating P-type ATPase [Cupriavidus]TSP13586.1 heavy metal translocating P-type ATPase [Cupriavidus campinensis]URF07953.1 heavy metal translocating P-type ATPase [Cupriavidus campinensis]
MARHTADHVMPHTHSHDHDLEHDHAHDHGHAHVHAAEPAAEPAAEHACCGAACGAAAAPLRQPMAAPAGTRSAAYRIEAMDCPTEETLIRNKLGGMAGVAALDFNLMQRVLTVHHTLDSTDVVVKAIATLGMHAQPLNADTPADAPAAAEAPKPWWPLALAGVTALGAEAAHWFEWGLPYAPAVLALAAVLVSGLGVYRKGWIAIRHGNLNINALMSIAVTGAMLIGQWPEAAMVMVLFALAERIEAASLDRARNAVRGLMAMAPEQATVQQPDGTWLAVTARDVPVGAVVRLRPGERVAIDGRVLRGQSALDQAPITGESVPVDKTVGDPLYAGSINQSGELEYTVTAPASDSTLARIIHAVEAAQGSRAPTQRFVDQFARVYTPVVFALAVAVAVVPPLLGGAWLDWIYKALVLLVIACPCALVISTPVTIVSGLAAAARRGILIKGGVYLEQGRHLAWLALDKTGTLTHGKPVQTDFALLVDDLPQARAIAASLAARSDHPVSRAVAVAAEAEGIAPLAVDDFAALPGQGVRGGVAGVTYCLGNHRLIHDLGACSPALEARLEAIERQGKTLVLLASAEVDGANPRALALFAVADTVRDTSRQAIEALHALGVKTLMLSGDNPHTVQAIGAAVGIDEVRGNQLPQDKADAIAALAGQAHTHGGGVGMVGDGINDAPALARADIGFAMGAAGTDTAIETADVALMDDDLRKIPVFVQLSRRTAAILKQNIALALGIKAVFLVLTVMGMGTMWMAVFADMGASLLVVFNGLRLARGVRS